MTSCGAGNAAAMEGLATDRAKKHKDEKIEEGEGKAAQLRKRGIGQKTAHSRLKNERWESVKPVVDDLLDTQRGVEMGRTKNTQRTKWGKGKSSSSSKDKLWGKRSQSRNDVKDRRIVSRGKGGKTRSG